jgi:exodeoxyribonuclease V alpha subunit
MEREILMKILEMVNKGHRVAFEEDWGGNSITVFVNDCHTHCGISEGVNFEDIMVLAPTRARSGGINALNEALRPIYGVTEEIPRTRFYVGDVVVATCNDYLGYAHVPSQIRKLRKDRVEIFNGTRGKIEEFKDGVVQIRFPQGLCAYDPEELDHYIEPAYAMTVHKAQGGQAEHIIISLLTATANRSLIYTAITRCKKGGSVTIVCQKDFIEKPPYLDENWASLSEKENGETPLPAEKCLSKLYLRVMQDLPISLKGI